MLFVVDRATGEVRSKHPGDRLRDVSTRGRVRPWRRWRSKAGVLARAYSDLGMHKKAERVAGCGTILRFAECPDGHERRLARAAFCHVRGCPVCAWRRSLVTSHAAREAMEALGALHAVRYVFLTLTVENVPGEALGDALDAMLAGWKRFRETSWFKARVAGFVRSLEVTRNRKADTYHPHVHAVLAVPEGEGGYFDGRRTGPLYADQAEWQRRWEEAMELDLAIVDVRAVRGAAAAASEAAKYETKPTSVLVASDPEGTAEAVRVLDKALAGRRMVDFGGELRKIHRELVRAGKVQEADAGDVDLVHVEDDQAEALCSVCAAPMVEAVYVWHADVQDFVRVAGPGSAPSP